MNAIKRNHQVALICAVLALVTLAIYWPVKNFDFLNYDDDIYVKDNPHVRAGLSGSEIGWAFKTDYAANWHPLTWLSHMLDCQLYGLNAGGHHLTNVLFHTANSLLVFFVLFRLTGARWPSALVAALFAWHPLHVESVAWVSERKDVLSAFFWLLTMLAYVRYAEKPGTGRYVLTVFLFSLGLLSKPMVVTLPFVLLLLDYWPLNRPHSRKIWFEKIPFFILSAACCLSTFAAQGDAGAVQHIDSLSLAARSSNALVSYSRYLGKIIWPNDLAVFYPFENWSLGQVVGAAVVLLVVSAVTAWQWRRRPYLAVGWLWFLGTLVPVIGLVQVGDQAMADRYSYLPSIGLFISIVWAMKSLNRPMVGIIASALILAGCLASARLQVRHWKNSEAVFSHALLVTKDNYVAYSCLGLWFYSNGQLERAADSFSEEIRIHPSARAHIDLAAVLNARGHTAEAVAQMRATVAIEPNSPQMLNNLAWLLATHPDSKFRNGAEAVVLAKHACDLTGNKVAVILGTLGAAYAEAGQFDDAILTAKRAQEVAKTDGQDDLVARNDELIKLYQAKQPFRSKEENSLKQTPNQE